MTFAVPRVTGNVHYSETDNHSAIVKGLMGEYNHSTCTHTKLKCILKRWLINNAWLIILN